MIDIKDIDKEVNEAMNYIEKMEKIELNNYFDIRVESRIRELEEKDQIDTYPFYKKVFQPVFVILLFIINIVFIIYFIKSSSNKNDLNYSVEDTYVNAIKSTYSVDQNTYDLILFKTMKKSDGGDS